MGHLEARDEASVDEKRAAVNAALEKIIPDRNITGAASRYVLLAPGHRWRPLLTMTLAEAFDNPYPVAQLACASECIHAASIIQDDKPCMDDARLRRGRPTCHVEFGEDIADLAKIRLIIARGHCGEGLATVQARAPGALCCKAPGRD
jgi:geranylgeranyl diphosphate synthase type II